MFRRVVARGRCVVPVTSLLKPRNPETHCSRDRTRMKAKVARDLRCVTTTFALHQRPLLLLPVFNLQLYNNGCRT